METKINPGIELPNNLCQPSYKQKFVEAPNPNKAGPKNREAMKCPSAAKVMDQIMEGK